MDAIELKRKDDSPFWVTGLVIFDELITGVLSSEYFIPVFTDAKNGLRIITLSYLLDNYLWPKKGDQVSCRLYYFITGNRPALVNRFEFYEDKTVETNEA